MKTEHKVIALSFFFGLLVWVGDALIDYLFFYEESFWSVLIAEVSKLEIYFRILVLVMFLLFGTILSKVLATRKLTEVALQESEEKIHSLYANMEEGVCLHEIIYNKTGEPIDYRITDVNASYESITGLKKEMAIGSLASNLYGTNEPPYLDIYAGVAETRTPASFEVYFSPMKKHFNISVFSPEKGKFATVFSDITDRKEAEVEREALIEELESKNTELEHFTHTVSHDLKSPLITIRGFLRMLEKNVALGDADRMKTDMDRISDAAEKMQRLLEELLELSQAGRPANPPEETSFAELAQDAMDVVAGRLGERNVDVEIAPDLPIIYADPSKIQVLLANLLDNAVKFMGDQSEPHIKIGAKRDGEHHVFYVRDNGVGIDPRHHEKVFDLFDKLDKNTEGTGVGLAIVKKIVEVHGGRVWVESNGKGTGTAFCFTIPDKRNIYKNHGPDLARKD